MAIISRELRGSVSKLTKHKIGLFCEIRSTHKAIDSVLGVRLDRLTKVTRPDGAVTSYSYTPTTVDTYRDQKAVNDQALHTEILYDGLGRESETRQYKSGSEYISTTRTYDALGQLATTTNPSIPGDGLNFATSYQSDGLGRNTLVQTADGAQVISSYAGNAVTVKDPAGHVRKTTSDALGRISSVTEDPVGLNYVTSYGYDPLNDLTSVTQSGQTRSFVYDSLGRLKTATNPESGTISYTYDANGNLVTKTDARNVIACFGSLSGTACTPGYDPLNRILNKTHSDGTPAVTYIYDDPTVPNAKGHLTSVSNGTSTTNYTNFDAVGNVLASNQIIAGETYTFGYTYNLADSLTKETYPSGRAVTTDYDSVNRPDATSGVLNGLSTPYASSVNYWPHGGLYYFVAGNNVVPVYNYNSRLQVSNFWATVGNDSNHFLLNIVPNWGASNNNGNLQSVQEGYGASVPWPR